MLGDEEGGRGVDARSVTSRPFHQPPIANGMAVKIALRRENSHGPGGSSIPACSIRAAWAKAAAVTAVTNAPQPLP